MSTSAGRLSPSTVRPAGAGPAPRRRRGGSGGPQRIVAPMPGRVVRVLVAPGDAVTARQGLLVVEAMKMENELRAGARRPGRVGGGHRGTVGRRGSGCWRSWSRRDVKRAIVCGHFRAGRLRGARRAWLVVAVAVAVLLVSVVTIDLGPALRRRAEIEGSNFIDRPLHIGRLGLNLGRGRLVLEDLRVDGLTPAHDPWLVAGAGRVVDHLADAARAAGRHRQRRPERLDADHRELRRRGAQLAAPDRAAASAAHRTARGHHHAAVPQRHARPVAGPRFRLVVGDGRPQPRSGDLEGRRLPRHAALLGRDPPHPAVPSRSGPTSPAPSP